MKRQDSKTKKNTKHKSNKGSTKNIALEWKVSQLLEGLNMFDGTNLTLISDTS